ncbi:hypothetical protein [Clostridium beijerinckii]|jgi:hypothetical protein|uniref:Uncharacterized protein n=3 Tax=Clostridium beijerinckii TaxID=1520 RepID=A0AAE2RWG0_CLOBE|nr:hypothetical protein [Clostridium beijerinckii]ABR33529.1 hypothetical protein Cbei_1349 [Clostridium beijerinckii NCIMB 8052]AIU04850.1 hypothetical protein Cbs_1349 [Clostridium beijerinckii ATCC 35702]MBF7811566.1 hypothetical protein [Clostridium beijerinckii]MBF7811943.1 hypothetical protein [Clostridium beijerinckii]NRT25206.1 hypothetical protein [Clostridium beijerinckii]
MGKRSINELSDVAKKRKEHRWDDLTSLIVIYGIEWEEDMAFCKLEDYKSGEAFDEENATKILYGFNEDEIWNNLFKVSNTNDYDDLHSRFKNAKWCTHENLMIFELLDGAKFCAMRL